VTKRRGSVVLLLLGALGCSERMAPAVGMPPGVTATATIVTTPVGAPSSPSARVADATASSAASAKVFTTPPKDAEDRCGVPPVQAKWKARCLDAEVRTCDDLGAEFEKVVGARDCAQRFYKMACEQGDLLGCFDHAVLLDDYLHSPEAIAVYQQVGDAVRKECASKGGRACLAAGRMREEALGGPRDDGAAAALYKKACDAGQGNACFRLGKMVQDGRAKRSFGAPQALFRSACEVRHAAACVAHASLLPASDPQRFEDVVLACGLGDEDACWAMDHDSTLVPPKK
jgi:hypothetical protein